MSIISKLTTLAAAGAGGEAGWILTVDDPSHPLLFADVDVLTRTTDNLIVVGHQDSSGEDGVLVEVGIDGSIVKQRIQNNNTYTYYNNVFEDYSTGDIFTVGAVETSGPIAQGITRLNSSSSIASAKYVDISGGSACMGDRFPVSTSAGDFKAVIAARSTAISYAFVTDTMTTIGKYITFSDQVGTRSVCQNLTSVAIVSENSSGSGGFDVISHTTAGNYDFTKRYTAGTYWAVPADSQGYNAIKGYNQTGGRRLAVGFNTNAYGTAVGCGILNITTSGSHVSDPIMCINDGGLVDTRCAGVEPDTGASTTYKPVYIYGTANNADGFVFRNKGSALTYSEGLRISGPQSGDSIEISGAVSRAGDFVYLAGWYTYNGNRQGLVMKLPKDLSVTGNFNGWTLSTPSVSTYNIGLNEGTTPITSNGTFNAGTQNVSTTLSSYSITSNLTSL